MVIGGIIILALVAGWFANELIRKKSNTTSSVSQSDLSNLEMDTTKAVNNTGVLDLVSPGGMHYQVYRGTDTQRIYAGNTIKISLIQKLNDSVLFSSYGNLPAYIPVSGIIQPYDMTEIWATVMAGDSIVATQLVDTFINRSPGSVPAEFKRGDRIISYMKILAVFSSDAAATADKERWEAELLAKEIKVIEKYLAANNITAERTPSGTFIEIIEPGTGDLAAPGKYVSVNYTGSTFSGKIFDSSTDSTFQHMYPISFIAGTNKMIKGFDEAILMMRPGAVARVYIPAMLGYGAAGLPNTIVKAYENLVFDISLVDVKDEAP